jgi:hypothetical protein
MVKIIKNLIFAGGLLVLTAGLVYWIEAEKEIKVLCQMFSPGDEAGYVNTTLETANLMSYERQQDQLIMKSAYNLYSTSCFVEFTENDLIGVRSYRITFNLSSFLVWVSVFISAGYMIFQFLLAMGYPLGEYAWGGKKKVLPNTYRYGSGVSVLIFALSILLLLGYKFEFMRIPEAFPVFGILFLISAIANFNSESRKEKITGTPAAILLYLTYLVLSIL